MIGFSLPVVFARISFMLNENSSKKTHTQNTRESELLERVKLCAVITLDLIAHDL